MTATSTAEPSAPPPPPEPHRRSRTLRATPIIGAIGAAVALLGLLLALRPVTTPVQDCGSALVFLVDGRTNEFADPDDPPSGVTAADAEANNANPCRTQAADAVRPAAVVMVAGTVAGLGAALVEFVVRYTDHRRSRTG